MKVTHYLVTALLVVGLLFVYHVAFQQKGGLKGILTGVGIGK